jgi:hypothetical protein
MTGPEVQRRLAELSDARERAEDEYIAAYNAIIVQCEHEWFANGDEQVCKWCYHTRRKPKEVKP